MAGIYNIPLIVEGTNTKQRVRYTRFEGVRRNHPISYEAGENFKLTDEMAAKFQPGLLHLVEEIPGLTADDCWCDDVIQADSTLAEERQRLVDMALALDPKQLDDMLSAVRRRDISTAKKIVERSNIPDRVDLLHRYTTGAATADDIANTINSLEDTDLAGNIAGYITSKCVTSKAVELVKLLTSRDVLEAVVLEEKKRPAKSGGTRKSVLNAAGE